MKMKNIECIREIFSGGGRMEWDLRNDLLEFSSVSVIFFSTQSKV